MANELTLSIKAVYAKSGAEVTFPDVAKQSIGVTVTGTRFIQMRQSVGTSEEALELGDIATGGFCIMINRDATNFVEVRPGTGATDLIRLKAGEPAMFRISADATAPYVIADTAAVEIEYFLLQN